MVENNFSARMRPVLGKSSQTPREWSPLLTPELSPKPSKKSVLGFAFHINCGNLFPDFRSKTIFPDMMRCDGPRFTGVTSEAAPQ